MFVGDNDPYVGRTRQRIRVTDRRTFLASLGALGLAACTGGATPESAPSSTGTTPTSSGAPSTAAPATTQPPDLGPLTPAPSELTDASFDLGVASGDPTESSVVLWTHARTDEDAELVWEVATDDTFATLVATGRVMATPLVGDAAPTKAVAEGLSSEATLWYRFRASDGTSPVGRTRTLPATQAAAERVRLAVSSCQSRATGAYAAHRDLAAAEVDLVVWIGDYIYENDTSDGLGVASDLAGYVAHYQAVKADPALQAAHAAHPWFIGTDDHEVVNDYDASVDPARRDAALRAWAAYQPVAEAPRRWRSLRIGDLVDLALLDTRSDATAATVLGDDQWAWLEEHLTTSSARWQAIASPTIVAGLFDHRGDPLLGYGWDRTPTDRARLAGLLERRDAFVVSGDLHTSMVLDVRADPLDPSAATVAPEFMAPAISSAFPADYAPLAPLLAIVNPQLRQIDPTNGWMLVDVSRDEVVATHRFVTDVTDPASAVVAGPTFAVTAGDTVPVER